MTAVQPVAPDPTAPGGAAPAAAPGWPRMTAYCALVARRPKTKVAANRPVSRPTTTATHGVRTNQPTAATAAATSSVVPSSSGTSLRSAFRVAWKTSRICRRRVRTVSRMAGMLPVRPRSRRQPVAIGSH